MGTALRIALFAIDLFVALTAIGGGIALAAGLESQERIPLAWLDGTPFTSYLIPGLILAVAVGGSAAIAALVVYKSRTAGGAASILAGLLLMGFILAEVMLLNQPSPWTGTEVFYFGFGLLMSLLGLVLLRTA
jgi:hypothetical protein